jgi:hypothetical protein
MTTIPENNDPLRNDALEDLKKQDIDDLITPDEVVFQQISDPEPADAPGEMDGPAEADPDKRSDR